MANPLQFLYKAASENQAEANRLNLLISQQATGASSGQHVKNWDENWPAGMKGDLDNTNVDNTKGTIPTGTEQTGEQLTIPGLDLAARRGLTIAHGAGASPVNPGVIPVPETGGYIIYDSEKGTYVNATPEQIKAQEVYNLHMQMDKLRPHRHGENTSNKQRSLQIA